MAIMGNDSMLDLLDDDGVSDSNVVAVDEC